MTAPLPLAELARFTVPPLELVLRGSVMYWFLFLIFRFILRRDVGAMGVSDFLFVVLLGDAAQNAMIGQATSVADGMVLIGTLVFWNHGIDWATWHFPALERLASASRLCLVRDGRRMRRNMRREFITADELDAKVREAGLESIEQVKRMYLESDGEISVIKR
jgi:uncharacterized membrane protein YcaP (DUF421 family)